MTVKVYNGIRGEASKKYKPRSRTLFDHPVIHDALETTSFRDSKIFSEKIQRSINFVMQIMEICGDRVPLLLTWKSFNFICE